jgi:hypothetical protein
MQFPPLPQLLGMKFALEINTLHAEIIIAITFASSGALTPIAVSLNNLPVAVYSVFVLALVNWIAVTKASWNLWLPTHWLWSLRPQRLVLDFFNSPPSPSTSMT